MFSAPSLNNWSHLQQFSFFHSFSENLLLKLIIFPFEKPPETNSHHHYHCSHPGPDLITLSRNITIAFSCLPRTCVQNRIFGSSSHTHLFTSLYSCYHIKVTQFGFKEVPGLSHTLPSQSFFPLPLDMVGTHLLLIFCTHPPCTVPPLWQLAPPTSCFFILFVQSLKSLTLPIMPTHSQGPTQTPLCWPCLAFHPHPQYQNFTILTFVVNLKNQNPNHQLLQERNYLFNFVLLFTSIPSYSILGIEEEIRKHLIAHKERKKKSVLECVISQLDHLPSKGQERYI